MKPLSIAPRAPRLAGVALAAAVLAGACANRPSDLPADVSNTPRLMVYPASAERVWSATQAALSAGAVFKIVDRPQGLLVTEFKTVDSKELSLLSKVLGGSTYRTNYTVQLRSLASERTEVQVTVAVQVRQLGLTREENDPRLEGLMRKRLFEQLSAILRP